MSATVAVPKAVKNRQLTAWVDEIAALCKPDRIYWCDGRHGHEFPDQDGQPGSKGLAARVFSCQPDGSDVDHGVYARPIP